MIAGSACPRALDRFRSGIRWSVAMTDVPAPVAKAKRSASGATATIAATGHPSPVSRIPVLAGVTTRTFRSDTDAARPYTLAGVRRPRLRCRRRRDACTKALVLLEREAVRGRSAHRCRGLRLGKASALFVAGLSTAAEDVSIGLARGKLPVIVASSGRGRSLSGNCPGWFQQS